MPNGTNEVLWGRKNRRTFAAENFKSDIMVKIARNLTELIGHTPLLELTKIEKGKGLKARLLVKIEAFNPARSVKDRVGFALIREAERRGLIDAKTVIIEPTSGNTGVGLAVVAASRGYRLILTMPDSMSVERRSLLKALGAEIILTPAHEGMGGAIRKVEELAAEIGTPISVAELIKRNNVENPELVSVLLNEEFLEHSEFDTRQVNDGDEIDFLYFMGGGQAHV